MKMQLLSARQRPCLKRSWTRRDATAKKEFAARKQYLGFRVAELEHLTKEISILVDKIRAAMSKDIDVLLYVWDSNDTKARATVESAMIPSGKPRLSNMQMERVLDQSLATSEVLHAAAT